MCVAKQFIIQLMHMFRITDDPLSETLVQCLAKTCKNDSIMSVDMDKVGVMAAYSGPFFRQKPSRCAVTVV